MSNAIRYDSLLVRDLARELHERLVGLRLEAVLLDRRTLDAALLIRPRHRTDADPSLLWRLHPTSGHLTAVPRAAAQGARVPLRGPAPITAVDAPPDERILHIDIEAGDAAPGAARRIVVELMTNQWNVLGIGGDGRIAGILRERRTRARTLLPGERYEPPARTARLWTQEPPAAAEWAELLRATPPGERIDALLRQAAWTSPLNAATILGEADIRDDDDVLERSRRRYIDLVDGVPRRPCLIALDGAPQPYPVPVGDAEAAPSLLDAFERAADRAAARPVAPDAAEQALAYAADRLDGVEKRMARLEEERAGAAAEADALRVQANLLLSQLHRVPRGASQVELDDFAGGTVRIVLDPALPPGENATRLYETARRRDRAARRVPALVRAAERERARLQDLIDRIRSGAATDEELRRIVESRRVAERSGQAALPYRTYRTSGGLEVRVGRGARANDELTFRHSAPHDIWLHARDVAGAHVILRWRRGDENPSRRDIDEAAVLAALHSRARTSGTVAVDYTHRKYVRKPRKSPPGAVLPERVRTVFVSPDPALEERLRDPGGP